MIWTTDTTEREGKSPGRIREPRVICSLRLLGTPVHWLRGEHGRRVLMDAAERWNVEGYVPTKLATPPCWGDMGRAARERGMRR